MQGRGQSDFCQDTIVALATVYQACARAIVRISGPKAWQISTRVFHPGADDTSTHELSRTAVARGSVSCGIGACPAERWSFPAHRSPTGEPCTELHLPGSPALVRALIEALIDAGCRVAGPGEFTRRAFLAGRMHLGQAEAVQALVSSSDAASARSAQRALEGKVFSDLVVCADRLERACAAFEVSFDFDEEAASQTDQTRFGEALHACLMRVRRLAQARRGNVAHTPRVVLAGPVNAGKSTIFNALVGEARTLVSEIAGTTRDAVSASVTLGEALRCELFDTAGLWQAPSELERAALAQGEELMRNADLLVVVIDGRDTEETVAGVVAGLIATREDWRKRTLVVRSMRDLCAAPSKLSAPLNDAPTIVLSAHHASDVDELQAELARRLREMQVHESVHVSARAHELLCRAQDILSQATEAMATGVPLEVVSGLARAGLSDVREMLGMDASTDVLDRIFADFCIGK